MKYFKIQLKTEFFSFFLFAILIYAFFSFTDFKRQKDYQDKLNTYYRAMQSNNEVYIQKDKIKILNVAFENEKKGKAHIVNTMKPTEPMPILPFIIPAYIFWLIMAVVRTLHGYLYWRKQGA